ncbi:hypothetical protein SK854_21705 [Lentzea sp. BCCO 10_0061]|uniref:Mce-associated membrane protein n=1 Tax=Lentzea sokolovensis TaxID=3095429 RepID=A0ABU4UYW4_9PSEU|nr:hypothetical protein [Lentzea sp. BCCO 10_0061]MDX8144743.1 hypothetical protein [Lentzea sp. BCCO 10_0061]
MAGLNRRAAADPAVEPAAEPAVEDVTREAAPSEVVPEPVAEEAELKAPEALDWTPPATPEKKAAAEKSEPVAVEETEPAGDKPAQKTGKVAWVLPVALVLVGLLLAGLGTFFLVKSRSVSYDAALVDSATTSAVNGQIREAVEKSFSYNFADVESTEKAAKELLTGKALCQYNAVFGPVKEVAPQQKLVVTVRVVSSAVSSLKDGRATVLVFADQVTTRTTDNQSGGGTAMLRVSAIDDGGRWKIDNMEMFGATAEQNRQLQGC